ncbi:MAG: class II aldolase/adducin family protein [Pseudomonadota bacterium]
MTDAREGVVQYDLRYTCEPLEPEPDLPLLCRWHNLFRRLGWLGRDPNRYGGDAYGNLSFRSTAGRGFVISGTQTGDVELGHEHVSRVINVDVSQNFLAARGPARPSSEALTHAAAYRLGPSVRWVFHVHEPTIWAQTANLGLPQSDPQIGYGTPAMAMELARLHESPAGSGILSMGGHRDGVLSFGESAEQAAVELFQAYAAALALL